VKLIGRGPECRMLEQVIESLGTGQSRTLVIHGEAGVGKSALLDYLAARASNCRIVRAVGVESEMELAFAVLHQLCSPMLEFLDGLPPPQRDALRTAFGISAGPPPDRFLVALAVLTLLSDVADDRPLLCLVDDEQWLDLASAQVLAFVARRLLAESVAIVFAARAPSVHVAGLPELVVSGLAKTAARALLDAVLTAPLDAQVRDQIVFETHGNPLALVEVPRGLTALELAGGFGFPRAGRFAGSMEESFRRRLDALPEQTRRLLLLAAAETTGDSALVWRAAELLGISADAVVPAADADLAELGTRVRFRHPLVRSAAYRSASLQDRQRVHHALAKVTDPELEADRRAWHRAHAASGPDEHVAGELERSASRAQARGGLAAAAAFLERATTLTPDRAQRAARALAAASAKVDAGDFDAALDLLATAEEGPLSELQHARHDLVQAQVAFVSRRGGEAPQLLLKAAKRLEPIDVRLSRATYLDAFSAAMFAGRLAVGVTALDVAREASAAPHAPEGARVSDLLLDGIAARYTKGYAAGVPILREALTTFDVGMPADEELRWLYMGCTVAVHLWDDERWHVLAERCVQLSRDVGALSALPLALSSRAYSLVLAGNLPAASALIEEIQAVNEVTGSSMSSNAALGLVAFRGRPAEVAALTESTLEDAMSRGEGNAISSAEWARAVLANGLGDYDAAMAAAQRSSAHSGDFAGLGWWSCAELVEAAVRSGMKDAAVEAHRRICELAEASGTDWVLGVEARSRALLSDVDTAERLYLASIEHLRRTHMRAELARAYLLYGEWLRRERRRTDARAQLRVAHDMFETMGMEAFEKRARRELLATGEKARKSTPAHGVEQLTPQEAQIARLARDGLSNTEIGGRLFLSARTVQYHLRKVFAKLHISSRNQLEIVLPSGEGAVALP
jgi:DNA-binding CsgD family transcriptional regulator